VLATNSGSAIAFASELDSAKPTDGNIWPIFIGLQLVLLACFLTLIGGSATPRAGSRMVEDPGPYPAVSAHTVVSPARAVSAAAGTAPLPGAAWALSELAADVAERLQPVEVERTADGHAFRMLVPIASVFKPGRAEPREAVVAVLDRIVAALTNTPDGLKLDVSLRLPLAPSAVDAGTGAGSGGETTLALRRGAAFAAILRARGGPPDAVRVGVRLGDVPDEPELALLLLRLAPPQASEIAAAISQEER
jgi:hypothetical protein